MSKASVSNAEDPNVRDDTIVEQDNPIGGVVSLQPDY
jgi:hypothetical protein